MTRPVGLLLFVALFTVAIIMGVATQVDAILPSINITHGLASLLFFDRFLLDFMIALLVGVLLVSAGLPGRVLCYAWCTIFFLTDMVILVVYITWNANDNGIQFYKFVKVDNKIILWVLLF